MVTSDACNVCSAFNRCIIAALNGSVIRCVHFESFQKSVNEAVDALNSIGLPNPLTKEEIENLIYRTNEMDGIL